MNKIGTADDGVIYFGYDEAKSTGAIVSRGKLVSSKILDITTTAAVTGEGGSVTKEAQIVISYIDTDKTVKTLEIPVSASAQLKSLADRLTAVETLVGTKKIRNCFFCFSCTIYFFCNLAKCSISSRYIRFFTY